MLLMDVQIWIVNNLANDPHGVVERAAPGGLPMDHAQSCLTGKGEMRKRNKKVAIKHGFEGARARIVPWHGWRVVRIGFSSWRTVPPLFSSCLALLRALDRHTQQRHCPVNENRSQTPSP